MAVKFRDYYETLGVARDESEDQIKKAYRKLARKFHPDLNPGNKASEERFKEINEAYEVLSDKDKRRRYDALGKDWKSGMDFTPPPGAGSARVHVGDLGDLFSGGGRFGGFSDFFETLFGGRRPGGGGRGDLYLRVHIRPHERFRLKDGGDIELELPIAPWEAVLGSKVEVPTLDGPVEMRIPPNSQGGKTLRLKGKGLALPGGGRGDQYVRLKIVVPPKPTEKEVELLKKLASESAFNARQSWN